MKTDVVACFAVQLARWRFRTDHCHKPPRCHVDILKHPAPTGGPPNSLPAPHGLLYSSASQSPRCISRKKKKFKQASPLHPRKAHLRVWVNTFMPQGPDEIKHQRHALYVSQKPWPCLLHLTIWVLHVHVCWTLFHTIISSDEVGGPADS